MIKIHFQSKTYLLDNPPDLKDFLSKVHQALEETLPPFWAFEYPNAENDYVVLDTEEKYQLFLKSHEMPTIFIRPRSKPSRQSSYCVLGDLQDSSEEENASPSSELKVQEELLVNDNSNIVFSDKGDRIIVPEEPVFNDQQLHSERLVEGCDSFLLQNEFLQKSFEGEEGWQDHFEKFQQAIRGMMAFGKEYRVEPDEVRDFTEKVKSVIFELLPLMASLRETYIEQKKLLESQALMSEIHEVQCSGCQKFRIMGIRYQCMVCEDFNFCEKCEGNQDHIHPFVKLKRRSQQKFLPQSRNGSLHSADVSLEKEPAINSHKVDLTKSIIRKDVEEEKIDEKKNDILSPKMMSGNLREADQEVDHKNEIEVFKEVGDVNRMQKGNPGKDVSDQGKYVKDEEEIKEMINMLEEEKIEYKIRVLKEVFGGERETLVRFVRENKDLEMDLLGEKYLTLNLN